MKLSIKSFTVPELFVDLPETASVASLKVRMSTFIPHEDVRSVFNHRIWTALILYCNELLDSHF